MKKKTTKRAGKLACVKKPTTRPKKSTVKKPAKKSVKRSAICRNAAVKHAVTANQTNVRLITGASEISVTENKIIVKREISENVRGRYSRSEVREYLDKTPSNMAAVNRKLQSTEAKKVTVKFKR